MRRGKIRGTALAVSVAIMLGVTGAASGQEAAETVGPTETKDIFSNPFEAVEVQTLSRIDTGAIGLLTEESGGLAADAWSGTERRVAELVLPRLPDQTGSPALADLARRLLLSRLEPPTGTTGEGPGFFANRLERLVALGHVGAIEPLAQQMGGDAATPAVLAARADAQLLQANDTEACDIIAQARGRSSSPDWLRRFAYCDGISGNVTGARLSVDLLKETGQSDEAFGALMARLVDGAKAEPGNYSAFSPVHFALLRKTGAGFPKGSIARAGGGFVTALIGYDALPAETRILAAEMAVSAGAVPAGALKSIYANAQFDDDALASAAPGTNLPNGPLGAALAFQKLQASASPAEEAFYLAHILKDARRRGVGPAIAQALRSNLAGLASLPDAAPYALELGIGEVLAGDPVVARRWLDLAQGDAIARDKLVSLLAVATSAENAGWTAEMATSQIRSARGENKEAAILVYALNRTLGGPSSAEAFVASLEGALSTYGAVPNSAPLEGLITASSKGRSAETLLFAISILGNNGVRDAHPATLVSVVGALRRAGFATEARALAAEVVASRL